MTIAANVAAVGIAAVGIAAANVTAEMGGRWIDYQTARGAR